MAQYLITIPATALQDETFTRSVSDISLSPASAIIENLSPYFLFLSLTGNNAPSEIAYEKVIAPYSVEAIRLTGNRTSGIFGSRRGSQGVAERVLNNVSIKLSDEDINPSTLIHDRIKLTSTPLTLAGQLSSLLTGAAATIIAANASKNYTIRQGTVNLRLTTVDGPLQLRKIGGGDIYGYYGNTLSSIVVSFSDPDGEGVDVGLGKGLEWYNGGTSTLIFSYMLALREFVPLLP